MKFSIRLMFFWIAVFLAFYFGILLVTAVLWGVPIQFWQMVLVFLIAGVLPPALITAYFYRRLDYMESEDLEPPKFKGVKKATLNFKKRTKQPAFDEVMLRIDRQWIISFSDRENRVLKFRTDTRMMAWGIGGYVKMTDDTTVQVVLYPMNSNSRREEKMMMQTLRVMQSILEP